VNPIHSLYPHVYNNTLYFASNHNSEFFRIYQIQLAPLKSQITEIFRAGNDVICPKRVGDSLFYIEIEFSQYLLRQRNLKSGLIKHITLKGVVFNYDFLNKDVIYTYADLSTPKSLMSYNLKLDKTTMLVGHTIKPLLNSRLFQRKKLLSTAYVIKYSPLLGHLLR